MKKMKKFLCLFLAMVMLIPNIAIFSNAVDAEQAEVSEPLLIEVTTDKSSYTAYGIAGINVKVINTSDEVINNISAEAVFEQLAPVGKDNETFKEVETLQPNESFEFSYKATVNSSKVKINFFAKIFLWFTRLFNGGYTATSHDIEADIENITEIKFGKYTVQNVVRVEFEITKLGMTDEEFEKAVDMTTTVSTTFEEILKSEEYNNLQTDLKKDTIEQKLNELIAQGIISSFNFNESSCTFSFEYTNGLLGGITVEENHNKDCFSSNSWHSDTKDIINTRSINSNDITYNKISYTESWLFVFGANIENESNSYNHFEQLKEQYDDLGVSITFWNNVTVSNYKFLDDYDLVYIMSHGSYDNVPLICTEEIYTEEKLKKDYKEDYKRKDIVIHTDESGSYFWIRPSFFENNYKNSKLEDSVILLSCCCAFGEYGQENYLLANSFLNAGADTVLGFCDSVNQSYSNCFYNKVLNYLAKGTTIAEAFDYSKVIVGENENRFFSNCYLNTKESTPAYPLIRGDLETKLFQESLNGLSSYTTTIVDSVTGKAIENVAVLVSNSETMNALMHLERTNSAGKITIYLPKGKYYCLLDKDGYISQTVEINLQESNTTANTPIYLEPIIIASVHGTVKDKFTNESIENGSVLLRLIENGTTVAEYSCSTDKNGEFLINVPTGTYNYTINKMDLFDELYETATGSITVVNGKENSLGTVYLTPKNDVVTSTLSGTVKDEETGNAISGVRVEFIDNSTDGFDTVATATTGADGSFSVELPYGSYSMSFNHDDYEYYGESIDIDFENIELPEPILLTPKNSSGGDDDSGETIDPNRTVIDSGNCGADGDNVKWVLYDDGELVISGTGKMADYFDRTGVVGNDYNPAPWPNTQIVNVKVKNGITNIGDYAFYYCQMLNSITFPDSVTCIGEYAFRNCVSLNNVIIPNSVTCIGDRAFEDCESLTNITIPSSTTSIGYKVFSDCDTLESVTISNGVTTISESMFYSCDNLSRISLPESIKSIEDYAFGRCVSLTYIEFPLSLKEIGENAFCGCSNLESILIPNGVITIGDGTFSECESLISVTVGSSVTTIGDVAFSGCKSLTIVTIGSGVTNIGDNAFYSCDSLKNITVNSNNQYYSSDSFGVLFNKDKTELIKYSIGNERTSYAIPNSVTTIGESSFYNCDNLTSITIPDSVITIGNSAFRNCDSLTSITIPNSVTSISDQAFTECGNLKAVTIGNGVETIGKSAFSWCRRLTTVTIGISVTTIGGLAFSTCDSLTDVYYSGSQEQWSKINIGGTNYCLTGATRHYNSKI